MFLIFKVLTRKILICKYLHSGSQGLPLRRQKMSSKFKCSKLSMLQMRK
jgi:hypothetical protein